MFFLRAALSADLYDRGFHNLVNIDYSDVVIERMRALHSDARPLMKCTVMYMPASADHPVLHQTSVHFYILIIDVRFIFFWLLVCSGTTMNMLSFDFPDASFDVVLDKAAMDALCVRQCYPRVLLHALLSYSNCFFCSRYFR